MENLREVSVEKLMQESAWISVRGIVFDVSKFCELHPGGKKLLLSHCGKDCTTEFELYHHSGVWSKYSKRLPIVGKLDRESLKKITSVDAQLIPFSEPLYAYQNGFYKSPYFRKTHFDFQKRVRKFVEKEIIETMGDWELDRMPPKDLFIKMGNEGLLACLTGKKMFPVEYVDAGVPIPQDFDAFHEYIVIDEVSRCGNQAIVAALTSGVAIALSAVLSYGSEDLKRKVAREVLMGRKTISLAVSEPSAGSDVSSLRTNARKEGDVFILDGNKKWITGAMWTDFLVVAAITLPDKGARGGTSLILVDGDTPGLTKRKVGLTPNSTIAGTAYLEFDSCRVPVSNLIGPENQAFKLIQYNFNHERIYHSIVCNRLARVCVEECFRFAMKRETFGKKLVEHDAIKIRLAQISAEVEAQQAWLESVVYQQATMTVEDEVRLGHIVCALKAKGGDVFEKVANETTHIFGGNALDNNSVGRRVSPMLAWTKAYTVPAGETLVMYMQSTKLACKFSKL